MARSSTAELLTEHDDGPDDGPTLRPVEAPEIQIPEGVAQERHQPAAREGQIRHQPTEPEEIAFFEADDQGNPLHPPAEPQQQPGRDGGREASLTEAEAGDGTYLDRQRAEQQRARSPHAGRRQAQKQGRDRMAADLAATRAELDDLRAQFAQLTDVPQRIAELGAGRLRDEIQNVEGQIAQAESTVRTAQSRMAAAIAKLAQGDETGASEHAAALNDYTQAVARGTNLLQRKQSLTAAAASQGGAGDRQGQPQPQARTGQPAPQPQPQGLPPAARAYYRDFTDRNSWYDPTPDPRTGQIRDEDTRIAAIIDDGVFRDGFRPETPEYWDELDGRLAERLPHRFAQGNGGRQATQQPAAQRGAASPARQQPAPQRRGPMNGGSEGRAPSQGNGPAVALTPERKQALIAVGAVGQDGVVADLAKFNRYMKQYQAFDQQNPGWANGAAR